MATGELHSITMCRACAVVVWCAVVACTPRQECRGDEVLENGACMRSCNTGDDCLVRERCDNGICRAVAGASSSSGGAPGTACATGESCKWGVCSGSLCAGPPGCDAIRRDDPGAQSGVFSIQPAGVMQPFDVYCEMTTNGGGWTLVYKATRTRSLESVQFRQWTVGDGLPALRNEDATPADEKYVLLHLPAFTQVWLRGDAHPQGVTAVVDGADGATFRAGWEAFFGPAGEARDLTGNPVRMVTGTEGACQDVHGVFRRRTFNVYEMHGLSVCLRRPGGGFVHVFMGDGGCGLNQCFADYHLIYPDDTVGDYAMPLFGTQDATNANVRLLVR